MHTRLFEKNSNTTVVVWPTWWQAANCFKDIGLPKINPQDDRADAAAAPRCWKDTRKVLMISVWPSLSENHGSGRLPDWARCLWINKPLENAAWNGISDKPESRQSGFGLYSVPECTFPLVSNRWESGLTCFIIVWNKREQR